MVGTIIENYEISSILGEGGMGIVYKALDLKLERFVALKILGPQAIRNPKFIERFKREAKNQAKLNHPNIVPVYGFTQTANMLGMVMEYVEGETLERLIIKKGKLDLFEALKILRQILVGVGYAHSKGFIHRDIKPSNIILNQEGTAKIMDFGISKSITEERDITKTGVKLGTILYMSPEQVKAMEPTNQSDIYSIGITFYEMLCGRTPFDYHTDYQILEAHLKKNPERLSSRILSIPPEVDGIISKALHKSLAKRYKSCEEFLGDIDILIASLEQSGVKKIVKRKEKTAPVKPLRVNLKFYGMIFFSLCVFAGLFYFVYTSVSQFWKQPEGSLLYTESASKPNYLNFKKTAWKKIESSTFLQLNGIDFSDDSTGLICGNQGLVMKTVNGGKTWQTLSDSSDINLWDVKFVSAQRGFIVGEKGTILFTTDAGNTWANITSNTSEALFNICFLPGKSVGFIVGGLGTILKSTDGGNNWQKISTPTNQLLYRIAFVNNSIGFAVGWNGTILKTTDTGNTWEQQNGKSDQYLRDISFYGNKLGFIVGGNGEVLKTNNGGEDWDVKTTNTISGLYVVKILDENNIIVLSSKGEIILSSNGGGKWEVTESGNYASLTGITITPSKKIFIIGYNGTILSN